MSLLNEALRKNHREVKKKENSPFHRKHSTSSSFSRKKMYRFCGLLLLLNGVVFGTWYLMGSLSAQVVSPVSSSSVSQKIKIEKFDPISETHSNHKEYNKPESDAPKSIREITPLQEPAESKTVKKDNLTALKRAEKAAPPSTSKAKKKPHKVIKKSPQKVLKEKARSLPSHQEKLFFQKALRYHRQGKLEPAIRMYQQVLKVKPDNPDALFNLASAYIQLAAYSEAYPLLIKLRNSNDTNPNVLINLAIAEIGLGKPTEAMNLLDMAAKQSEAPQFKIYFHRAAALSRLGKLKKARNFYKKAEELNSGHPTLIFNLAVLCDKLQRFDEAVDYYRLYLRHSNQLSRHEKKNIEARMNSLEAYMAGRRR